MKVISLSHCSFSLEPFLDSYGHKDIAVARDGGRHFLNEEMQAEYVTEIFLPDCAPLMRVSSTKGM
jgi:hypothetical protein